MLIPGSRVDCSDFGLFLYLHLSHLDLERSQVEMRSASLSSDWPREMSPVATMLCLLASDARAALESAH